MKIVKIVQRINNDRRSATKMAPKVLYCAVVFVCALWIESSSGSAIPMWEYLSRGEKVNNTTHRFTIIANLSPYVRPSVQSPNYNTDT